MIPLVEVSSRQVSRLNPYIRRDIPLFGRIAKAIPAYGLMMSVRPSVCPSVCLSVRPSTFWLTSAFKFVLGHINQYRLDTLHGKRP